MDKRKRDETSDTPSSDSKESVPTGGDNPHDLTNNSVTGCFVVEKFWNVALGFARWTENEKAHIDGCTRCQDRWQRTRSAVDKRRRETRPTIQNEMRRTRDALQGRRQLSASKPLRWPIKEAKFTLSDPVTDLWRKLTVRSEEGGCIRLTFPRAKDVMFVLLKLEVEDRPPVASTGRYAILHWGESTSIPIKDVLQQDSTARFSVDLIPSASSLEADEAHQLLDDASWTPVGTTDHKVWVEWSRHWLAEPNELDGRIESTLRQINENV